MRRLRRYIKIVLALVVLLVAGAAAVVWFGVYNVAADRPHHSATQWLLETARERSVANHARSVRLRLPKRMDEALLHEAVVAYEDMCADCHAPPGRGRSALSRGLHPPAPDLTRIAQRRSPEELFWVIKHGVRMTGMPAWGSTHTDDELWPLVALVRRFPDLSSADYEQLLAAAREAGFVHRHHDDRQHDYDHRDRREDYDRDDDAAHGARANEDERHDTAEHEHDH